jgi:hypothetical protein
MRTRPFAVLTARLAVAGLVSGLVSVTQPVSAAVTTTPVVWLCRPGIAKNPCEIPLDTTNFAFHGPASVTTPFRLPSRKRPVDCFYVYPTVSNQLGVNATKAKDPEIYSIAKYQAARFSSVCRMYAPVYRQVPLAGIPTLALGEPKAYADVRQAWFNYLSHYNKGRGVILIGHSQGTLMLRKLIHDEIDSRPPVRKRLVGAFLMGGNVTVAQGKKVGGDFRRTPLCSRRGQFGCVVAYSTYSTDPTPASFFGNTLTDVISPAIGLPSGLGYQVACTDPAKLSGITRPVGITVPTKPFAPGAIRVGIAVTAGGDLPSARTTWVQPADRVQGACRTINGATVYRYDSLPGSRKLNEFPPLWGTHLVDVNLGLDRLVRIARLQAKAWLASR